MMILIQQRVSEGNTTDFITKLTVKSHFTLKFCDIGNFNENGEILIILLRK